MMKKIMVFLVMTCANLSATPEAIVFDFGGVMTKEPNREAVVRFLCESFSLTTEEFTAVNQEKRKAVQTGKKDQDFWLDYAKRNNVSLPKDWVNTFNHVMKSAIGVNPDMYNLVAKLKEKGLPVALLSNIDDRLAGLIREFDLYAPFNPCLLSCEIGLEKPDPKIYKFLLEEMKLPATSIIFVDDKLENIEAAQKLGFDAIWFSSKEQLQMELKKRGVVE